MNRSNAVIWLSSLVAMLALVAAGTGLFWQTGGSSLPFTTLRGTTAEIYGQGLYHYDTVFSGAGFRGQDAITLFLGVPLLLVSLVLYSRNSLRGGLLLTGMLGYFLYVYASMALSAAYNSLFLVYVALFSANLFAFILAFTATDEETVFTRALDRLPYRCLGTFMLASGLLTFYVWTEPIINALLQNRVPDRLDSYTTFVTTALDLAIITPSCFLSGLLLLRRRVLGYRIAFPLLVLIVMLAPMIIVNTVLQMSAGVVFTTPEIVGPITGFTVLGLIAMWLSVTILRAVSQSTQLQAVHA